MTCLVSSNQVSRPLPIDGRGIEVQSSGHGRDILTPKAPDSIGKDVARASPEMKRRISCDEHEPNLNLNPWANTQYPSMICISQPCKYQFSGFLFSSSSSSSLHKLYSTKLTFRFRRKRSNMCPLIHNPVILSHPIFKPNLPMPNIMYVSWSKI